MYDPNVEILLNISLYQYILSLTAVHGRFSVRDLRFEHRDGEHNMDILGWLNLVGTRAVCVASEDMIKYLDQDVLLQNFCSMFLLNDPAYIPMLNELCLCLISSKGWFRCIVIGRRDDWLVYCVDIGSVQTVPGSCIRGMNANLMFPVLSVTCELNLADYAAKAAFCSDTDRFMAILTSYPHTAVHRVNIL